jgi:hypothetical protein
LELDEFVSLRPYVYHLTSNANVSNIRERGSLLSASALAREAGSTDVLERRRSEALTLPGAVIRDQSPLHSGNIELAPGFSFRKLLDLLNDQVFFWPGAASGPIPYGHRHFGRYAAELPSVLRMPVTDLFSVNSAREPFVCRFNSGSPRCSAGRKSPRGPDTFVSLQSFQGTPSRVIELVYRDEVDLPDTTEVGSAPTGPWTTLS